MSTYTGVVEGLRRTFRTSRTLPLQYRKQCLQSLICLVEENSDELCDAMYKDIRKCKSEAYSYENLFVINEAEGAIRQLDNWAKARKVLRNILQALDKAYVAKQLLGVVLIIGTWNYPVQLLLCPLVGALSAGNCAVLKPSEMAPAVSDLLCRLFLKYFDQDVISIVKGGPEETIDLLKERFDHIFFTGSTSVGKSIMVAAARHLTPVTLELGGKCPTIVDETSDIALSARRITWGKFMTCGQTCVAPDYVFCHESIKNEFIEEVRKCTLEFYGSNPQMSPDYGRIINEKHFNRLMQLTKSGRVVLGGTGDQHDLYIHPTILDDVLYTDPIMREEVFGPILPVLTYTNIDEALEYINDNEKPLSLYIFSTSKTVIDTVLKKTFSGAVTINDVIMHMALETLPFGGVGHSGMGRYHGKFSFDCFTHERAVLHRPQCGEKIVWMRYPPYDLAKLKWAKRLLTRRSYLNLGTLLFLPLLLCAVILAYSFKSIF